jgi:hypothetical protein
MAANLCHLDGVSLEGRRAGNVLRLRARAHGGDAAGK